MNELQPTAGLNERLSALDSDLRLGTLDETAARELIEEIFTRRLNMLSAYDKRVSTALSDEDYVRLKRRKEALIRLLPEAYRRFSDKYPTVNLADELIQLNAPATALTFEDLNREYDYELAAAIRLLDALRDADAYDQAAEYFPSTREESDSVTLPNLTDAVHSDDALKAAKYLIHNGAMRPDNPETTEKFRAVLALIDSDSTQAAQARFIETLYGFTDSLLGFLEARRGELRSLKDTLRAELTMQAGNSPTARREQTATATTVRFAVEAPEFNKLKELDAQIRQKETDLERAYTFVQMIPARNADAQLYEGLDVPEVRCPYDMCFAFISLMSGGCDDVWLYNLAYSVLLLACRALPWADSGAVDPDNLSEEPEVDYEYLADQIQKMPDWDDNRTNEIMYKKQLHSPLCTPDGSLISISQLAFLASGLIPPRHADSISYTKAILHDSDLSQEQIELLYEYLSLACAVNRRDGEYTGSDESEDDTENDSEKVRQLRGEIKHLRSVIHQLEQRGKETEKRLSEADRRLNAANEELAELRTMIRESGDSDDAETITVAFPYTAKKRSVIIGGHDSWVKAIRPLLDNVRFISSSEQPNPGIILNSEVVWLQTNALGHSGYYKIIDIVRRNRIKVCYFRYASAEKCAEQFALEDMAEDATDA